MITEISLFPGLHSHDEEPFLLFQETREKTVTWFEDCAFSSSDVLSSVFVLPVERNMDRRSRLDTHVRLTP